MTRGHEYEREVFMKHTKWPGVTALLLGGMFALHPGPSSAAEDTALPYYLRDRGEGIHTSLFGTYVTNKEFLFYPFYEYTKFSNFEYKPEELGFTGDQDYFGQATEKEFLVYFAYGISDSLMVEFESALYSTVDFTKASDDTSNVPNTIDESGLGDTEMQVRWRWMKETERRPEGTFFFETVFPLQKNQTLLGTQDWEFSPGLLLTKGFRFGTLTLKLSLSYTTEDNTLEFGEYSLEYVKKVSNRWRFVAAFEGQQDEQQIVGEAQYHFAKNATLKLNLGLGVTEKAPDYAPEIGVLFSF